MTDRGDPIHGEVSTADASAGVAFTLYPSGSTTARTLAAGEYLTITDITLVMTAGGDYCVAADTDAAGRRVVKGKADALGGLDKTIETPFTCPKGVVPKLICDAGQVTCTIQGYITGA